MLKIYSKSRKYTVNADTKKVIPKHKTNCTIITTGRHSTPNKFTLTPLNNTTTKMTTKLNNIFTNWLIVNEIGKICRGKYIFLTISCCAKITVVPVPRQEEKNSHGTNATNKNKYKNLWIFKTSI